MSESLLLSGLSLRLGCSSTYLRPFGGVGDPHVHAGTAMNRDRGAMAVNRDPAAGARRKTVDRRARRFCERLFQSTNASRFSETYRVADELLAEAGAAHGCPLVAGAGLGADDGRFADATMV